MYIYTCTKDMYPNGIAAQGARGPVPLFGGDDLTQCEVVWCQVIWSSFRRDVMSSDLVVNSPPFVQPSPRLTIRNLFSIFKCMLNKYNYSLEQCLDELF